MTRSHGLHLHLIVVIYHFICAMITIRVKRHLHKSDNTIVIQVASCLKYFVLLQDSMLESHLIYIYSFICKLAIVCYSERIFQTLATLKDCAQSWLAKKENDQCYPRISKYKSVPTLIWIEMNFFGSLVTTRLMIFAFALDRSHPRLLLSPGKNPIFFFSFFFLKNQVWTTTTNTSPSNTFSKKYAKYLIYTISSQIWSVDRADPINPKIIFFLRL